MPDTWKNGEHVDHDPIVEARAAHLMGHQRRVARSAVAIQTGCRAACREQTAADVLEARKALLLFLSVRTVVYEKGPVRFPFDKAQAVRGVQLQGVKVARRPAPRRVPSRPRQLVCVNVGRARLRAYL